MRKHSRFSLSFLFVATYVVAVCMSKNLLGFTVVMMMEPVVIWTIVFILMRGIPRGIIKASNNNCYRIDGSVSDRRAATERNSISQVRWNLYFVLIVFCLASDWLYLAIDGFEWAGRFNSENSSLNGMVLTIYVSMFWLAIFFVIILRSYHASLQALSLGIASRGKDYVALDLELLANCAQGNFGPATRLIQRWLQRSAWRRW